VSYFKCLNPPNSVLAGASPQTTLGMLTALPRPHSWIKGVLFLTRGRGQRGGERTEGKEGEGKEKKREGTIRE